MRGGSVGCVTATMTEAFYFSPSVCMVGTRDRSSRQNARRSWTHPLHLPPLPTHPPPRPSSARRTTILYASAVSPAAPFLASVRARLFFTATVGVRHFARAPVWPSPNGRCLSLALVFFFFRGVFGADLLSSRLRARGSFSWLLARGCCFSRLLARGCRCSRLSLVHFCFYISFVLCFPHSNSCISHVYVSAFSFRVAFPPFCFPLCAEPNLGGRFKYLGQAPSVLTAGAGARLLFRSLHRDRRRTLIFIVGPVGLLSGRGFGGRRSLPQEKNPKQY